MLRAPCYSTRTGFGMSPRQDEEATALKRVPTTLPMFAVTFTGMAFGAGLGLVCCFALPMIPSDAQLHVLVFPVAGAVGGAFLGLCVDLLRKALRPRR